eukprot:gnl/MRDRNA2_/MRDRNA2_107238_c0_seq1.p1 gnl/MRDRNA2_/MRDRNA2_107238_c0~~gnl/MRDRNA2_/MRDRNA2_107238_c0_seq1.p1  ORF type:complete len:1166 (+),score=267.10 gnl/MRDRNA2_/MRDRNA2_107238_c0_seq1:71-3568(+)
MVGKPVTLEQRLHYGERSGRRDVISQLRKQAPLDSYYLELAIKSLQDEDDVVRTIAVEAVGRSAQNDAAHCIEALAPLLGDSSAAVQRVCIKTLASLGDVGVVGNVEAVIALLSDGDWRLRQTALEFLTIAGEQPCSPYIEALVTVLEDPDDAVRCMAVKTLRNVGGCNLRLVIPSLGTLCSDQSWQIREALATALGDLLPKAKIVEALGSESDVPQRSGFPRQRKVTLVEPLESVQSDEPDSMLLDGGAQPTIPEEHSQEDITQSSTEKQTSPGMEKKSPGDVETHLNISFEEHVIPVALKQTNPLELDRSQFELCGDMLAAFALEDCDIAVRLAAARSMGKVGRQYVAHAPAIESLLQETDSHVRAEAAQALGNVGVSDEQITQKISELLRDRSVAVRRAAVQALGCIGSAAAEYMRHVAYCLSDSDRIVRLRAACFLGRFGPAAGTFSTDLAMRLTDNDAEVRRAVVDALASIGEAGWPHAENVSELMHDKDTATARSAAQALASMGESAVPHLSVCLSDPSPFVRAMAANALAKVAPNILVERISDVVALLSYDEIAVDVLRTIEDVRADCASAVAAMLRDSCSNVATNAARALKAMGSHGADAVAHLLFDLDEAVRVQACDVLSACGQVAEAHVDEIALLLVDQSRFVRAAAASALGALGNNKMDTVGLQELLKDIEVPVRIAAAKAIAQLAPGRADVDSLVGLVGSRLKAEVDEGVLQALLVAFSALRPASEANAPIVARLLRHRDRGVRRGASEALGKMGRPGAACAAWYIQRPEHEFVRRAAVHALGETGGVSPPNKLAGLLRDKDWQVRWTAAHTLGKLGVDGAHEAAKMLNDDNGSARQAAVEALRYGGDIGANVAAQNLTNKDRLVRCEAAKALLKTGNCVDHAADLLACLNDPADEVRKTAASALGRIGGDLMSTTAANSKLPVVGGIGQAASHLLSQSHDWAQQTATTMLNAMGPSGVEYVTPLVQAGDWTKRRTAAATLGLLRGPAKQAAQQKTVALLKDNDWEVRKAAAEALRGIDVLPGKQTPPALQAREQVDQLSLLLRDADHGVRSAATKSLGAHLTSDNFPRLHEEPRKIMSSTQPAWNSWVCQKNGSKSAPSLLLGQKQATRQEFSQTQRPSQIFVATSDGAASQLKAPRKQKRMTSTGGLRMKL